MTGIKQLRDKYYDYFDLRMSNQEDIEQLQKQMQIQYSGKTLILIEGKIRRDLELKAELLSIDGEIMELLNLD